MVKRRMNVIVLAATKGGVGKTTLASALAVRAAEDGQRVALIDLDPQESLAAWSDRRGTSSPKLLELNGATAEALELAMASRYEWVFVDTPPGALKFTEPAIAAADFALIPMRASALDVDAIDTVVEVCRDYKKPYAFVLNHAHPSWKLTKTTLAYLDKRGHRVCKQLIGYRMAYISAMTLGKSGPEVERGSDARSEIDALWAEVKELVRASTK